jgi:hypothetical protein
MKQFPHNCRGNSPAIAPLVEGRHGSAAPTDILLFMRNLPKPIDYGYASI